MARNKRTQAALVLDWLNKYGEITTREAVTELNIMALAKRIEELRKRGHIINTEYRKSPSGARYGVYSLYYGEDRHPQHW